MPIAGLDDRAMRLAEKIVAIAERLLQRTGLDEGAGIGRYANDSAQRQRRNAETGFAKHDPIEPSLAERMERRVFAKSVNEDIHVGQDQKNRRTYSRSSDSRETGSSRSIPGIRPPFAALTRGTILAEDRVARLSSTTRRKPSSIKAVSDRPCS